MTGIATFTRLDSAERALAVRCLLLVAAIRGALWLLPFRTLDVCFAAFERLPLSVSFDVPLSRMVWAVRAASRRVPGASCLTQSVALHCLLVQAGHRSSIYIGVAKDAERGFQAHAWVETDGRTLLGAPFENSRYTALCSWNGRKA